MSIFLTKHLRNPFSFSFRLIFLLSLLLSSLLLFFLNFSLLFKWQLRNLSLSVSRNFHENSFSVLTVATLKIVNLYNKSNILFETAVVTTRSSVSFFSTSDISHFPIFNCWGYWRPFSNWGLSSASSKHITYI